MMYYRRKIILSILEQWGGQLSKTDLQKILFLFSVKQQKPSYEFVPYQYGCYSFLLDQDRNKMIKENQIENESIWRKSDKINYTSQLTKLDKEILYNLKTELNDLHGKNLIKYVYDNYPYYTINSKIANEIIGKDKATINKNFYTRDKKDALYTIGYEGKSLEEFINELIKSNIKVLCDVRNNPVSMKFGFTKYQLVKFLGEFNIKYIHIPELGIESSQRKKYIKQNDDYITLFNEYKRITLPKESSKIDYVIDLLNKNKRIALMCFEKDITKCHRYHLTKSIINHPEMKYSIIHL